MPSDQYSFYITTQTIFFVKLSRKLSVTQHKIFFYQKNKQDWEDIIKRKSKFKVCMRRTKDDQDKAQKQVQLQHMRFFSLDTEDLDSQNPTNRVP